MAGFAGTPPEIFTRAPDSKPDGWAVAHRQLPRASKAPPD